MNGGTLLSSGPILVVDDDASLCGLLSEYFAQEGFAVEFVPNGAEGEDLAISGRHAIVLLDVMLPDIDGFDLLRRIRAKSRVPVLMLTAKGDYKDRIIGLRLGADDYVSKPFDPEELLARITAILRRLDGTEAAPRSYERVVVVEDIEMDKGARIVKRNDRTVELTALEFDLLAMFLASPGHVIERERIARAVLGRDLSPFDRSLDTHICHLRRKLGPKRDGTQRIKGIRACGYAYTICQSTENEN